MSEISYASEAGTAGAFAELLSLLLIVGALVVVSYLNVKVRSRKTFQFEMLVFVAVLAVAEIPRTLYSLDIIDLEALSDVGLELHSISMLVLSAFVGYRVYGFAKGRPITALEGTFEELIMKSVDEALIGVFGENTSRAVNFYFDRSLAVSDPAAYERGLVRIFGEGSKLITSAILDSVCKRAVIERSSVKLLADGWSAARIKLTGKN